MSITLSPPTLLSTAGSTRATAYNLANKSVRIGDVTHVTWLDAVARVMVRRFDHVTGAWSETLHLDDGIDNHTNPCLTATPDGTLRVAYGPHGFWDEALWNAGRFAIQESVTPGDSRAWQRGSDVGYGATYACLVADSQGRNHLLYRGGANTPGCFYERQNRQRNWDRTTKLSWLDIPPGYTFVGANLAIAPGDVLYAGFHYYSTHTGRSTGVCALCSGDGGDTWTGVDGTPVTLPLPYDPRYAIPHGGENPYLGSLAIDEAGNLVALTMDVSETSAGCWLSVLRNGQWETADLHPCMPAGWQIHLGNVTVDARGRILVVVDATRAQPGEAIWGHASMECFLLASTDGGRTFVCQQISETDPTTPNWLPNISRTGPNHDLRTPLILYTHGVAGETCTPSDRTEVYGVWVE